MNKKGIPEITRVYAQASGIASRPPIKLSRKSHTRCFSAIAQLFHVYILNAREAIERFP